MISIEEIKKACEFADGIRYKTETILDKNDTDLLVFGSIEVIIDQRPRENCYQLVYYPLFLQRVIEGINRAFEGLGNGTNSYKTVDRYTTYISGLGTWTQSQDTDAPDGFGHSLKMLCTAADASPSASDRMLIQTKLEGQDVQSLGFGNSGNTYTVSFYVKSNVTGTYILEQYGDTASATGNNISTAYTIDSANTWERKTITLNVDSGAMTSDNTSGLVLSFWLGSGTTYTSGTLNTSWSSPVSADRAVGQVNLASAINNYWQITGVQLEVGPATPFEHRSYSDELAKCQRYFYAAAVGGATKEALGLGVYYSSTYLAGAISFPVTMRATPTLDAGTGTNYYEVIRDGGTDWFNTMLLGNRTTTSIGEFYNNTQASGTSGAGGFVRTDKVGAYVHFDAEL